MAFTFNGTSPSVIIFNGNDVEHVDVVSGSTTTRVWDKSSGDLTQLIMYQNGTINTSAIGGFTAGSKFGYTDPSGNNHNVPSDSWGYAAQAPVIRTTKTDVNLKGLNHIECDLYARFPCSYEEVIAGAGAHIYFGLFDSNDNQVALFDKGFSNWHSSNMAEHWTCSFDFTSISSGYVKLWATKSGSSNDVTIWVNNLILTKK